MKHYTVLLNGKVKATFNTKSQALLFATIEHNKTKKATGQNIKFAIIEQ